MSFRNPLTTLPFSAISGQITTSQITPGSITTPLLAAGAVTTDKLTVVGTANLLPDPSFETAAGAALVAAAGPLWSLDTVKGGNGSPTSAKLNATSGTTSSWSLSLSSAPALPADQVYLQFDYAATAFTGNSIKLVVQWLNGSGGTAGFGTVVVSAPVLDGAWRTVSGTYTAPAGTTKALFFLQAFQATAATVWFDNVVVRPVLGTTSIQAGSINTAQLNANAINGMTIVGAVVETAASGKRAVLQNDSGGACLTVYTGNAGESPGALQVGSDTSGDYVNLYAPWPSGYAGTLAEVRMTNNGTSNTGSVNLIGDVVSVQGALIDALTSLTLVGIVQDWTTPTLAATYAAGGGGNGTPQYRVINIGGTRWVEWRGGVTLGYTGTTLNNSANFLASALPYAPPNGRSVMCAAQWLSQWSVRVDFQTSGGTSIVGTGSSYAPTFLSLNGVRYPI